MKTARGAGDFRKGVLIMAKKFLKNRRKVSRINADRVREMGKELSAAIAGVRAGNEKFLSVSISDGNDKMGHIRSVSILPVLTCPARCRETCAKDCYAVGMCFDGVKGASMRRSYARNTALWMLRPDLYFAAIDYAGKINRFFRWHVSGDIPNAAYFAEMVIIAVNNPGCKFLAFTKQWEIVNAWIDENGALPSNLQIIFSGWFDEMPINPYNLPVAVPVMAADADKYPDRALCGGNCETCACRGCGCWNLWDGQIMMLIYH